MALNGGHAIDHSLRKKPLGGVVLLWPSAIHGGGAWFFNLYSPNSKTEHLAEYTTQEREVEPKVKRFKGQKNIKSTYYHLLYCIISDWFEVSPFRVTSHFRSCRARNKCRNPENPNTAFTVTNWFSRTVSDRRRGPLPSKRVTSVFQTYFSFIKVSLSNTFWLQMLGSDFNRVEKEDV